MKRNARFFILAQTLVIIAILFLVSLPEMSSSAASGTPAPGTYTVTFLDGPACGNGYYFTEWGVQLGNQALIEPSNLTISQIPVNGYSYGKFNLTTITFLVPDGVYPFTLYPANFLKVGSPNGWELGGSGGFVTVTNSNVTVYTDAEAPRCGP